MVIAICTPFVDIGYEDHGSTLVRFRLALIYHKVTSFQVNSSYVNAIKNAWY